MTKEELEKFIELNDKFTNDCERVVKILESSKERTEHEYRDIRYAETFYLEDNSVYWEGEETWLYGGNETNRGYFDADYLTMTDKELMKVVDKENEEYNKKLMEKKKKKEKEEKERKFAMFNKLKEELGK